MPVRMTHPNLGVVIDVAEQSVRARQASGWVVEGPAGDAVGADPEIVAAADSDTTTDSADIPEED